jgi:hypothetical protein
VNQATIRDYQLLSEKKILTPGLKATASQRIEISRKEQKEQKNNKCQPYQKFVIPDRSLTGSGIQGNALKSSNAVIARLYHARGSGNLISIAKLRFPDLGYCLVVE